MKMHTRSQNLQKSKDIGTNVSLNTQSISSNSDIVIKKSTKSILEEESETESVKIQVN